MSLDASGQTPKSERLVSIDALRGFDMFWIVGGDSLVLAVITLAGWPPREIIAQQLRHVPWEGFHFLDLIFPLFLFIVGTVLPFSLGKLRELGAPSTALYVRVLRRGLMLFALGLLCNGVLRFDFANLRVAGVLQRIALCYAAAGLITLRTSVKSQVIIVVSLLLGYWALLSLVGAPGFEAGDLSKKGNLPGYVDRHWLPGKINPSYYGDGDNEGIVSTLPAIATTLIGVLAGHWLRSRRQPWTKVAGLALAGLGCLGAGYVWSSAFPIIKILWTSSYVLFAAGWSLLLLALFYGVIDVLGWRRWAFFFVVIGANAITIYVARSFVSFDRIANFFFGGVSSHSPELYQPAIKAFAVVAVEWALLYFLYRKKIFLRV
jgi:predicted acyltransferase